MKPNSSRRVLQGFYDIQMVCSTFLTSKQKINAINSKGAVKQALIKALNDNVKFLESVTQFTSNHHNVKYRIETFIDILKSI